MKVAFKKVEITPTLPVPLSGFGRKRIAHSIHDPLYARVFLFKDNQKEILWVQLDLVAIDQDFYDLVEKKTGLSSENILLSATHTHSGPGGTLNTTNGLLKGMGVVFGGEHNPVYCEEIVNKICDALKECRKQMENATVRIIKGKVYDLGTDRHDETLECDQDALLLEFSVKDKKACIVRLACHPTVLNADNLEITADFCGQIEPNFPEYEMVAYVNGSCGDMSTRFTRKSYGFEESKRFGTLVSNQLKELLKCDVESKFFDMEIMKTHIKMKTRSVDPIEVAMSKVEKAKKAVEEAMLKHVSEKELRLVQSFLEGAQNNLLASTMLDKSGTISVPVSALKLGELTLIFTPFELFSKLSNPYKKENLEYISYTNGYYLYLPDCDAFDKQFYEANSCIFERGAGEELMRQIDCWINGEV